MRSDRVRVCLSLPKPGLDDTLEPGLAHAWPRSKDNPHHKMGQGAFLPVVVDEQYPCPICTKCATLMEVGVVDFVDWDNGTQQLTKEEAVNMTLEAKLSVVQQD